MGTRDIDAIRHQRTIPERFHDIAKYCDRITSYSAHHSESDFLCNSEIVAATERCLSVIGDVVDTLSSAERKLCSDANWTPFAGLGDYLIHGYRDVDLDKIWSIVRNDVPPLKLAVERALRKHFPDAPAR